MKKYVIAHTRIGWLSCGKHKYMEIAKHLYEVIAWSTDGEKERCVCTDGLENIVLHKVFGNVWKVVQVWPI